MEAEREDRKEREAMRDADRKKEDERRKRQEERKVSFEIFRIKLTGTNKVGLMCLNVAQKDMHIRSDRVVTMVYTSCTMVSSDIPCNVPLVTCIF